jgi:hypothetical protein
MIYKPTSVHIIKKVYTKIVLFKSSLYKFCPLYSFYVYVIRKKKKFLSYVNIILSAKSHIIDDSMLDPNVFESEKHNKMLQTNFQWMTELAK